MILVTQPHLEALLSTPRTEERVVATRERAGTRRRRPSSVVPEDRRAPRVGVVTFLLAVPAAGAALPLVHGLHLPKALAPLLAVALVLGWWWFITRAAAGIGHRGTWPSVRRNGVAALVIGIVIGYSLAFWAFNDEIEAVRADRALIDRFDQLQAEMREQQVLLAAVPTVDRDENLLALARRLRQVTAQLPAAERDIVCERDGTCGSRTVGEGPNYREKVMYRDELERQFDELPASIADRRGDLVDARNAGEATVAGIDAQLREIGHRPEPLSRVAAGYTVAGTHWPVLLLLVVVAAVVFFVNLLVALLAGWLVHRPDGRSRDTIEALFRQREREQVAGDGPGRGR